MKEKQTNRQKSKDQSFSEAFGFRRSNPKTQGKEKYGKTSIKIQISVVKVPIEKKQKTKETQKNFSSVGCPQKVKDA